MKTKEKLLNPATLALFVLFSFLLSCTKEKSTDVNQDKIYAEYELFYDKNKDKTYAGAIFRFSNALGTNLELVAPSEVRFDSVLIPYDPILAYYRKEYAGKITSGTFKFKDANGLTFSNTVNLAKIIANPVIDTIKRTGSFTYTWLGDSIATNEKATLTIGTQVFIQNAVNSKDFVLALTQLNQLPIGVSTCQLDRSVKTTATSVTSAGGIITGRYRAMNTTVYVK